MGVSMITSRSMPLQLAKEIDEIYRVKFAEAQTEYDKLFKVQSAPAGATYYTAEITGLGLPSEIGEAEGVPYSTPVEGNPMMRTYKMAGLGYIVTKLMIDDERFDEIKKLPADLARSMRLYMDIAAADFYDGLNDTEKSRDGSYVCSEHSLLNDVMGHGSVSNYASTGADISETTFKAGIEYYDDVVDELGAPLIMKPDKLIVSSGDQYIAHRLLTEMYGSSQDLAGLGYWGDTAPTSGNKADGIGKNFANPANGFVDRWSVFSSRFLSGDNWFLRSAEHDIGWYWKEQPTQKNTVDFDTDSTKYKSKMRFGTWCNDYRGIYGNFQ